MRRVRAVLLAGAAVATLVAILGLGSGGGTGNANAYTVDAIFDVARGIGPQQVVKVAGAQVGTVTGVRLTSSYQARVEMSIEPQFAPFRANASCSIEPEGLISENFVECDPGTPSAPVLAAAGSTPPTVPVSQTSEPISLQDLFNIWTTPVSERLAVLLDDLGVGVSGRAGDIRAILERANPTLAAADRTIALVNRQRTQLQQIIDAAAPVTNELAPHDTAVQRFIDHSAALTTVTAEHRGALAQAIAELPPLLRSARPALQQLAAFSSSAPPLLGDLRGAAPQLTGLTEELPPFSVQAVGTLNQLSPSLRAARTALTAATPTLEQAARFSADADPAGESLDQLLVSLRDSGAFESLLRGLYNGAALTSHYDADSHVIFADMLENACMLYSTVYEPSCDAHVNGTATIPSGSSPQRRTGRRGPHRAHARHTTPAPAPTQTQPATTSPALTVPLPKLPVTTSPAPGAGGATLQKLLSFLIR